MSHLRFSCRGGCGGDSMARRLSSSGACRRPRARLRRRSTGSLRSRRAPDRWSTGSARSTSRPSNNRITPKTITFARSWSMMSNTSFLPGPLLPTRAEAKPRVTSHAVPSDVRHATDADRERALDTISRAFFADPVWSWAFPGDSARRALYPDFWNFFLTAGLRNDAVRAGGRRRRGHHLDATGRAGARRRRGGCTRAFRPYVVRRPDRRRARSDHPHRPRASERRTALVPRRGRAPTPTTRGSSSGSASSRTTSVPSTRSTCPRTSSRRTRRTSSAIVGSASNCATTFPLADDGPVHARPCGGRRADIVFPCYEQVVHIVTICGSLQSSSSNEALLRAASRTTAGRHDDGRRAVDRRRAALQPRSGRRAGAGARSPGSVPRSPGPTAW